MYHRFPRHLMLGRNQLVRSEWYQQTVSSTNFLQERACDD
jgi:hypothetical protein